MQATVATYSPESRAGTVLLDDGTQLSFDRSAFDTSGLRLLRLGQRVALVMVGGRVVAMSHSCIPPR